MNEDVLKNLLSEFRLWGVKPEVNHLNSGHIELVWHASEDKPSRRYIIPKTGSDWRGWLNARAKIRQPFKADGLDLKARIAKPKPVLHKALEVPGPVETDADQIRLLRAEISDLSELVLGIMTTLKELIAATPPLPAPPPSPPLAPVEDVIAGLKASADYRPPARRNRSVKALDVVSSSWNSTDALARDMGVEPFLAYRKLYYLSRQNLIEKSGDRWRKKPAGDAAPEPATMAGHLRTANGISNRH